MIVKFTLGQTHIFTKDFRVTKSEGVGNLEFVPCDSIWTGDCHIYPADWNNDVKLHTHISFIDSVQTRSSLNEDNEEWKILFTREDGPFSYEYEWALEDLIGKIKKI